MEPNIIGSRAQAARRLKIEQMANCDEARIRGFMRGESQLIHRTWAAHMNALIRTRKSPLSMVNPQNVGSPHERAHKDQKVPLVDGEFFCDAEKVEAGNGQ
jgi:hypothetical protein